jgi:hypothetical protein
MQPHEEFNPNFWQQHYLQLEAKRFEVTLKHFFEMGFLSHDDYNFLVTNLKMIKSFLKLRFAVDQTNKPFRNEHQETATYNEKSFPQYQSKWTNPKFQNGSKQPSLFDYSKKSEPIPVKGEIIVSGLNESLQALKSTEPEKTGPKFPYKIPAGTHWNNVIIKFLDDERIEIHVRKLKHTADYIQMGMVGKGNVPEPSEQWTFLRVLAQCQGEITIKDTEAKDKYKKQKQELTEILQRYFSIDYDPFYPYKSSPEKNGNSYKIKLTLIPPPVVALPNNPVEIDEDLLGIQEFLSEEAPQIVDD